MSERSRSPVPPASAASEDGMDDVTNNNNEATQAVAKLDAKFDKSMDEFRMMFAKMMGHQEQESKKLNELGEQVSTLTQKVESNTASNDDKFKELDKKCSAAMEKCNKALEEIGKIKTAKTSNQNVSSSATDPPGKRMNVGTDGSGAASSNGGGAARSGSLSGTEGGTKRAFEPTYADIVRGETVDLTTGTEEAEKVSQRRLWGKGFGRKLPKGLLYNEADRLVKVMNEGLEGSDKFNPKIMAYHLEMSFSLIFRSSDEMNRFHEKSREHDRGFTWTDPLGGDRKIRIVRDASFDQRVRGQVYHHLKEETQSLLVSKSQWSDKMFLDNTGYKGSFFISNGEDAWELVNLDWVQMGGDGFLRPNLRHFEQFGAGPEEVEALLGRVLGMATLMSRRRDE